MKIAIQGVRACFHDVAVHRFFKPADEPTPVECRSFKILCESLAGHESDRAVMAIENTIAGSILTNYSLLERYLFKIIGEVYVRIELSLMALPSQSLQSLRFVQSHPMALLQCEEFLFQHSQIRAIEGHDTAESAKIIADKKLASYGAIAPALAAKTYGLNILKNNIESHQGNYTRFLVICRNDDLAAQNEAIPKANKTSLCFETSHTPGSLVSVLEIFKYHGINMTKIQSVPILGQPYQYSIHVDLEWDDAKIFRIALIELQERVQKLIHFGDYPRAERPTS